MERRLRRHRHPPRHRNPPQADRQRRRPTHPRLRPLVEAPHGRGALQNYRSFLFHQDYFAQVKPFPHVRDLFLRFKQSGIRTALASSSAKADLDTYMKIANISALVDETTSADDAARSK